ncbi:MAG: hypothetical protein AAFX52_02540 [Pseudomonadota bacterium]
MATEPSILIREASHDGCGAKARSRGNVHLQDYAFDDEKTKLERLLVDALLDYSVIKDFVCWNC